MVHKSVPKLLDFLSNAQWASPPPCLKKKKNRKEKLYCVILKTIKHSLHNRWCIRSHQSMIHVPYLLYSFVHFLHYTNPELLCEIQNDLYHILLNSQRVLHSGRRHGEVFGPPAPIPPPPYTGQTLCFIPPPSSPPSLLLLSTIPPPPLHQLFNPSSPPLHQKPNPLEEQTNELQQGESDLCSSCLFYVSAFHPG